MKILITGGAGFIGSHLAEKLLREGEEVLVIDDLSTGTRKNIEHLEANPKFHFVQGSILERSLLEETLKDCELIYHLAASVGVKYIIDNPLKSIQINVNGTENVLDLAAQHNKIKVIIASSSEVYGKNERGPLKESDDRIQGATSIHRWSYACTKALDEFMAMAYYRDKGLPVIIIRFFNICGPRQTGRYGMVIPRFVKQALLEKPITVYADGQQVRTFTYISDALEAVITLARHPEAVGEIFNIGSSEATTILELAGRIKALTKSRCEITHIPYERAYKKGFEDMRYRVPDISKLSKLTGYSPRVKLDEMLQRIIDYFKERQN